MKKQNNTALLFATNMFGTLKPEIIKRINKFLRKPTVEAWEDIHCIIIDGSGKITTIWNAVIKQDPFFPRYGRRTNSAGEILREWERIPSPDDVITAINKSVN